MDLIISFTFFMKVDKLWHERGGVRGGGKIPNRLCIFSLLPDINLFEYLHPSIIKF